MTALDQQNVKNLPFQANTRLERGIDLDPSLDRQTRLQETIHEYHWDDRARIINALADESASTMQPLARRLAACGSGASFYIDPEAGKVRPWISRCGSRLCPFCGHARTASTTEQLLPLMLEHHADRIMVLTIRSHDFPLWLQVKQLLHCFKKLRARASFRKHVTGGVYILEITVNKDTGLWHPHLHILIRGNYYPHAELSKQWREITRDSMCVWITKVDNAEGAARELAKYVGKIQRIATLTPAEIREYAGALKGVRMLQTFGDLHGKKLKDQDKHPDIPRPDVRVRLSTLLHVARSGHQEAIVLLTWLCLRFPVFGRYAHHEMPQLIPDPRPVDRTLHMLAIIRGETPPPPPQLSTDLTEAQLDHKICQAFMTYQAQLELGTFANVVCFHRTETEYIDGNNYAH